MADRAEVTKVVGYSLTGQPDAAIVPKVVAYLILEPGESGPDTSNKQGHVYSRIVRR